MYPYYSNPMQQIIKVTGMQGAQAYQMAANSSTLMLDSNDAIIYLKTTDGAGYPTITSYDITPHIDKPAPDISNFEERLKRLEEIINEQSNITSTKRNKPNGAVNGTKNDVE